MKYHILRGDSEIVLASLPDNTFDFMVTDPPGGIGFMAREWDSPKGGRELWVNWLARVMKEALRVLKPGAHAFVWAIPRTSHWTGTALEMAGFEVRDRYHHVFGSGMQHAKNASKAIDHFLIEAELGADVGRKPTRKELDAEVARQRPIVGTYRVGGNALTSTAEKGGTFGVAVPNSPSGELTRTTGATEEAREFDGYYTAAAPGCEDWWLVRKPLEGTLAENLLKWGTGAINIDATRVPRNWDERGEAWKRSGVTGKPEAEKIAAPPGQGMILDPGGSVPKNIVFTHSIGCLPGAPCVDDCPVGQMDAQAGPTSSRIFGPADGAKTEAIYGKYAKRNVGGYTDAGGVSRYFNVFYCTKTSRRERDHGCGALPPKSGGEATGREDGSAGVNRPHAGAGRTGGARNHHPTVKPGSLVEFLTALVGRPGALGVDPFSGSGSHGVSAIKLGMEWLGIELGGENGEYFPILEARLAQAVVDYEARCRR